MFKLISYENFDFPGSFKNSKSDNKHGCANCFLRLKKITFNKFFGRKRTFYLVRILLSQTNRVIKVTGAGLRYN